MDSVADVAWESMLMDETQTRSAYEKRASASKRSAVGAIKSEKSPRKQGSEKKNTKKSKDVSAVLRSLGISSNADHANFADESSVAKGELSDSAVPVEDSSQIREQSERESQICRLGDDSDSDNDSDAESGEKNVFFTSSHITNTDDKAMLQRIAKEMSYLSMSSTSHDISSAVETKQRKTALDNLTLLLANKKKPCQYASS